MVNQEHRLWQWLLAQDPVKVAIVRCPDACFAKQETPLDEMSSVAPARGSRQAVQATTNTLITDGKNTVAPSRGSRQAVQATTNTLITDGKNIVAPARGAVIIWDRCLKLAPVGLVAKLLALQVRHVQVAGCVAANEQLVWWKNLTPTGVSAYVPIKQRGWLRRQGPTIQVGEIEVPRRFMFGVAEPTPFDLEAPEQYQVLQALALIDTQDFAPTDNQDFARIDTQEPIADVPIPAQPNAETASAELVSTQESAGIASSDLASTQRISAGSSTESARGFSATSADRAKASVDVKDGTSASIGLTNEYSEIPIVPAPILQLHAKACTTCDICVKGCPTGALTSSTQTIFHSQGLQQDSGQTATPTKTDTVLPPTKVDVPEEMSRFDQSDMPASRVAGAYLNEEEGYQVRTLAFTPSMCVQCDVCLQLCPSESLTWGTPFDYLHLTLETTVELATNPMTTCTHCQVLFAANGKDACELCDFRKSNPFGYRLPPGFIRKQRS